MIPPATDGLPAHDAPGTTARRGAVLIVEDDRKVGRALQEGFEREGFSAVLEASGESAFFRLDGERFDLVILDLNLPGRDGLEILRRVRQRGVKTPVLIVTARDTVEDRVVGLDAGADDYVVKPFAFAEILARVRALLRRGPGTGARPVVCGDLTIDIASRRVTRGGQTIDLTSREFEVLDHLARHEGEVVPREALAKEVWRESARSITLDNVIDVHMARLRRKLESGAGRRIIQTVRGVGFVLKPSDDE